MKCPICRSDLVQEQTVKTCDVCGVTFHLDCWEENGGCGTTGCPNVPKKKDARQTDAALWETYWGATTKACPACGEIIKVNETICPFCNEHFTTDRPITPEEYKTSLVKTEIPQGLKRGAVTLFIFSVLGITAPLTLFFGGLWYRSHKQELKEMSPLHHLLAVCGLVISAVYCGIIVLAML